MGFSQDNKLSVKPVFKYYNEIKESDDKQSFNGYGTLEDLNLDVLKLNGEEGVIFVVYEYNNNDEEILLNNSIKIKNSSYYSDGFKKLSFTENKCKVIAVRFNRKNFPKIINLIKESKKRIYEILGFLDYLNDYDLNSINSYLILKYGVPKNEFSYTSFSNDTIFSINTSEKFINYFGYINSNEFEFKHNIIHSSEDSNLIVRIENNNNIKEGEYFFISESNFNLSDSKSSYNINKVWKIDNNFNSETNLNLNLKIDERLLILEDEEIIIEISDDVNFNNPNILVPKLYNKQLDFMINVCFKKLYFRLKTIKKLKVEVIKNECNSLIELNLTNGLKPYTININNETFLTNESSVEILIAEKTNIIIKDKTNALENKFEIDFHNSFSEFKNNYIVYLNEKPAKIDLGFLYNDLLEYEVYLEDKLISKSLYFDFNNYGILKIIAKNKNTLCEKQFEVEIKSWSINDEDFVIYPVPSVVNQPIFLKINLGEYKGVLNIYDTHGKMLESKNLNTLSNTLLDFSFKTSGFYFIQIVDENNQLYSKKIIIK